MSNTNNKNEAGINLLDLFLPAIKMAVVCAFRSHLWRIGMVQVRFGSAGLLRPGDGHYQGPSNKTSSAGLDRYENLINKVNVANELLQFRSAVR